MTLLIAAAIIALAAILVLIRPLLASRGEAASRAKADAALYRAQLDELKRDVARGTITEAEAEGARVEISRRLLAAARQAEATGHLSPGPAHAAKSLAVIAAVLIPMLALATYLISGGDPWEADQPFAARAGERALAAEARRPSQETAERLVAEARAAEPTPVPAPDEAEHRDLVAKLVDLLADRPDDQRGRELLVRSYMSLGEYAAAWQVQRELIGLKGPAASADDIALMAEAMVRAADGYVSPEAEAALRQALELDPAQPVALYYGGMMLAQTGRLQQAVQVWQALTGVLPPDSPAQAQVAGLIAQAEAEIAAGGGAPGPDAAALDAAAEMSPADRLAMIEGMVAGLEARLADGGGSAEEWVRLIRSYRQLGRSEDARRALEMALEKAAPSDRDAIAAAAAEIGVVAE